MASTRSGAHVTSMPFGVAMNCGGAIGHANVDMSGTPFIVVDAFAVVGSNAAGDATWSADQRSVEINGEGWCGWNGPALAPFNPMNDASGELVLPALNEQRPRNDRLFSPGGRWRSGTNWS